MLPSSVAVLANVLNPQNVFFFSLFPLFILSDNVQDHSLLSVVETQ